MPLFYQKNILPSVKLGIWHIEEDARFFLAKVPEQRHISHPHKRLQHLAGRYLLQALVPDFPYHEMLIADTRKPYLPDEQYHFSLSHCGNYAAAIVSNTHRCGIDIEMINPVIHRIQHKFIHPAEWAVYEQLPAIAAAIFPAVLWSAKEAVFKWYSLGGIDFKQHMQLCNPIQTISNAHWELPFIFQKSEAVYLTVSASFFGAEQLVLSNVITSV